MEEPQGVVDLAPDHQYRVVQAVAESVDHLLLHLVFCLKACAA